MFVHSMLFRNVFAVLVTSVFNRIEFDLTVKH